MHFLRDLLHWFLYGSAAPQSTEQREVEHPVETKPKNEAKKKPVILDVVDNILSEGHGDTFLKELKSIKPMSKQFDKDHNELIQEVKRLSSRKHR
jgi:hypothetical protein